MVLYMTTASLAKASILVFYLRILVAKIDKIVTKITLGVVVVYYIAAFLILCLQCRYIAPSIQPLPILTLQTPPALLGNPNP
jgi:hypothetical protein